MVAKIIEGSAWLKGEGAAGPVLHAVDGERAQEEKPEEEPFEGSDVLIAIPQMLDNGQIALVIVGQARVLRGVKLAVDGLKLGED